MSSLQAENADPGVAVYPSNLSAALFESGDYPACIAAISRATMLATTGGNDGLLTKLSPRMVRAISHIHQSRPDDAKKILSEHKAAVDLLKKRYRLSGRHSRRTFMAMVVEHHRRRTSDCSVPHSTFPSKPQAVVQTIHSVTQCPLGSRVLRCRTRYSAEHPLLGHSNLRVARSHPKVPHHGTASNTIFSIRRLWRLSARLRIHQRRTQAVLGSLVNQAEAAPCSFHAP